MFTNFGEGLHDIKMHTKLNLIHEMLGNYLWNMNINQYIKSYKPLLIYNWNRDIYMVYGILDGNLVIWEWWIHRYHNNTHDLQTHKIIEIWRSFTVCIRYIIKIYNWYGFILWDKDFYGII